MENAYAHRIGLVREMMKSKGLDAMIITGSDPHCSEYPAPRWKQVEWLSGFTGEAGDLVITQDHAGLWTDTRYFIQANQQLDGTGVELHKTRIPGEVLIPEWLAEVAFHDCPGMVTVAVDGLSQTVSSIDAIKKAFRHSGRKPASEDVGKSFRVVDMPDFIEFIWNDRPLVPSSPIITLGDDITGESRRSKLSWLRQAVVDRGCDSILMTSLDEIAWLLNVRGSDVEHNPVVMSYLVVTQDDVYWFVKKTSCTGEDSETRASFGELSGDGVELRRYDDISVFFADAAEEGLHCLYVDPSTLNFHLSKILSASGPDIRIVSGKSPVALRKAVKNEIEVAGMREAHLYDGLAIEKFLYWLDRRMASGDPVSEWEAAMKLGSLRSGIEGYMGDSFQTISAYGPDAALPHYVTPERGSRVLEPRGLYLCDSGGQYLFGTTDITRTVPLGPCTDMEREDYTLVLKGHIALAMAIFPRGTAGCQIDYAARSPLWQFRRNFGHGTGHGVGFFLNVHEGPQDIRQNFNRQPLLPGMITSDEPGLYREGRYGIRHESLLLCADAGINDFGEWLCFENLTLCHIDTSAVVPELMSDEEVAWLNAYNERVYRTLSPELTSDVAEWLRAKTLPVR